MEKEMVKSLGLVESRTLGDGFGPLVPVKPRPRFGAHSSGLCTCERKALILSRCVKCAMGDHALPVLPSTKKLTSKVWIFLRCRL